MNTLAPAAIYRTTVTGLNGAGSISIVGTEVGDVVLINLINGTDDEPSIFEHTITVANEIQQVSSGNLSADTIVSILAR